MADADDLTPGLEEAIGLMAKTATGKMCTGTFGSVVSYDHTTQKVSVQPVIRGSRDQAEGFRYPAISNVPVTFPACGAFSITWPIKAGDFVWLNFADRSIDEWLELGGTDVEPRSKRRFNVTDAVALPGGRPFSKPLVLASGTDLVIGQDGYDGTISNPGSITEPLQLRIGPAGIRLGDGGSTNDLLNILDTLISQLLTATAGGSPLVFTDTGLTSLKGRLDTILWP